MKRWTALALAALMALMCVAALAKEDSAAADSKAEVATTGGWLNMRREPTLRGRLVKRIPNRAEVEYHGAVDDEWSRVTFSGATGYVQTCHLNLMRTAEGKVVYADASDQVFVRATPSADAPLAACLPHDTALEVAQVDGGWTKVAYPAEEGGVAVGYVPTVRLQARSETPQTAAAAAMDEYGQVQGGQTLRSLPDGKAEAVTTLAGGAEVLVQRHAGGWCRVTAGEHTGYLPVAAVKLSGRRPEAAEAEPVAEGVKAGAARKLAEDALKRACADFSARGMKMDRKLLASAYGMEGPVYVFTYLQDGSPRYCAAVQQQTGKVGYLGDYTAFAAEQTEASSKRAAGPISESRAKSIAASALRRSYSEYRNYLYAVEVEKLDSFGSHKGPVYRLRYRHNGYVAYTCHISVSSGKVLQHREVWKPMGEFDWQ